MEKCGKFYKKNLDFFKKLFCFCFCSAVFCNQKVDVSINQIFCYVLWSMGLSFFMISSRCMCNSCEIDRSKII